MLFMESFPDRNGKNWKDPWKFIAFPNLRELSSLDNCLIVLRFNARVKLKYT